jgi:AcrR family transcriptional regulator
MRKAAASNIKATREDWLAAALAVLIADGVESVKVLTLSRRLKVSRSSFYWYFKSRKDLLSQLLAHWRETNNHSIAAHARRPSASVAQGVLNLFECWVDPDLFNPQLDFAIRAWARSSKAVRRIIDQADRERLQAITEMYARHGFAPKEAFVRARILYFMQIGYYSLGISEAMDERLSLVPAYIRGFSGQDATAAETAAFADFVAGTRAVETPPGAVRRHRMAAALP